MDSSVAILPQFRTASKRARLEAARPLLDEIKANAKQADAQLVSLRDHSYHVMQTHGLAQRRRMKPNSVGFHPSNRSGTGLIPAKCRKKLSDFAKSGFSLIECARACAVGRVHGSIGDGYELQSSNVS